MPRVLRIASAAALTLALATPAAAHRAWINPSATVLSGNEPWVTFDAAVSNTLFYPEHVPIRADGLVAIGPDGETLKLENLSTGKYRSTFDLPLTKPGTYKIASISKTALASYKIDGEVKRWRGSPAELASAVPQGASEVQTGVSMRRIETFVTAGAPTVTALKTTGEGLEMAPITHPNDLVAGEPARFRMLLDGAPAANLKVEAALGSTRYRADAPELEATTDADGVFQIAWPEAGVYWIEASVRNEGGEGRGGGASYVATFEVLPE